MTDMEFGLTLMIFGGGLTLLSLGFIAIVISLLVRIQSKEKTSGSGRPSCNADGHNGRSM